MSTVDEQKRATSNNVEHDSVFIAALGSITFNMGSGTDTSSNRYLNLPNGNISYGIQMMPTVACSVTVINGHTLKSGMSVGVQGWNDPNVKITSFTIVASSATTVEVEGKN